MIFRSYTIMVLLISSVALYAQQPPQGFFLDDAVPKAAIIPEFSEMTKSTQPSTVSVNVNFTNVITAVSPYVYGNNANIYMTQMVDQPALLQNLQKLSPNVLRFPGGNLSSVYMWNADKDVPPSDAPPQLVDANGTAQPAGYWYGNNTENWTCSVDNFYNMLEATGNTGMITINYGYARYSTADDPVASAAHLAAEWVRYDNGRTRFWEIGNESNGTWQAGYRINTATNKDGQPQIITGALYGEHFLVFADSMRKAANETGATIYIGAQLLQEEPQSWWNATDKNWNDGVLSKSGQSPDFYIVHSYYTPYETNSSPAEVLSSATSVTQAMMAFVTKEISDAGLPSKPIALTEWNIFATGSKQQTSYINGMHAAIVLGELIKNKYGMASRWDLANGWENGNDHGLFSKGDEPGAVPLWNPRAAYYYMYYFQKMFGDHMISSTVSGSTDVLSYASRFDTGEASVVVINTGTSEQIATININNFGYGDRYYVYSLLGGTDNGQFSLKVSVNGVPATFASGGPVTYESIPAKSATIGAGVKLSLPAHSVHYVLIEKGTNVITAVEDDTSNMLSVYPNPAKEKFDVRLPARGFEKIEVIDTTGKVLRSMSIMPGDDKVSIHGDIPSGLYVIRMYKGKQVVQAKIVIE